MSQRFGELRCEMSIPAMNYYVDKRALVRTMLAQCNEARRAFVSTALADTMIPLHEWPEHCIRMMLGGASGRFQILGVGPLPHTSSLATCPHARRA